MTKKEFVRECAVQTGYSQAVVAEIMDCVFATLAADMSEGGSTTVRGFGTFDAPLKPAYSAVCALNGKTYEIPERRNPRFRASVRLREELRSTTHAQ